jgi:peptidase E
VSGGETARDAEPEERRTILALGGGGFTVGPGDPVLDELVLALAFERARSMSPAARPQGDPAPRILFLPTASGDPTGQVNAFRARFGGRADCGAAHLSLFDLHGSTRTLEDVVAEQDAIYAGGGSMRNLLAIWQAHGLDRLLVEAWERGTVLAGISAGAMCWFEAGVTRSSGPPEPIDGLGVLPGSLSVHADGEPERLPVWLEAVRTGALPGGWAVDDGCALLFRGRRLERAVSSRPGACALRVDAVEGELVRRRIDPELLGAPPLGERPPSGDILELRQVQRLRGRR